MVRAWNVVPSLVSSLLSSAAEWAWVALVIAGAVLAQQAVDESPGDAPRVLARAWHAGHGALELSTRGGRALQLARVDGPPGELLALELTQLPEDVEILSAALTAFLGDGLVVALAAARDGRVGYHYLVSDSLELRGEVIVRAPQDDLWNRDDWLFTEPIFSSEGEPYRIVELSNPGGDSLEIGFRRGHPRAGGRAGLDQKLFVDSCPIAAQPLMPGRSQLFELGFREAR